MCGVRILTRRERYGEMYSGNRETDTFNDKQSQIAERKTGGGRGPGDRSKEAVEQRDLRESVSSSKKVKRSA